MNTYSVYRARSMCPSCAQESEIFITNKGVFPYAAKTCSRCSVTFPSDDFVCSLVDLTGNISVSAQTSLQILSC